MADVPSGIHTGPVTWDGEYAGGVARALPEDKDGLHERLTIDDIRECPIVDLVDGYYRYREDQG